MSKVLFLANHDLVVYNFRLELIEALLSENHEVVISCPYGDKISDLIKLGVRHIETRVDRHGMNPFKDAKLVSHYRNIIKTEKPDIIFSYTIKPNIYGAIAAKKYKVPFVANITGLGLAVENGGLKQKICILLYKYAFTSVKRVFFQNADNMKFFIDHKIAIGKHDLLPGSGVNLKRFSLLPYPDDKVISFVFAARIMKEKGIDLFLETAKCIKEKYKNVEFHVCGFLENEYKGNLIEYEEKGIVKYHGMVRNLGEVYRHSHCLVLPSYYPEGISNVLLEAMASGRPVITTDRPGCREPVENGINGYLVPIKDQQALNDAVELFLSLSHEKKELMGKNGRKKVESEFDRNIVVNKYLKEIL